MVEKVEYILSLKDLLTKGISNANNEVNKLEKSIGHASGIAGKLGIALGALGAVFAGSEILSSTAKIESLNNSITFISGSSSEAGKNFAFLKDTSDKLGTSLLSSSEGFKTIAGAARGTSLEGNATRDVFLGISEASARMGLSGEQSEGALMALGQMISKGKVQAEELRGQLGERIPGAFQIAARSMNMTTQQLDKFMSQGNLLATDFLPKFANQLHKEFGGAVPNSIQSMLNKFENLKTELMSSLIPAVSAALTGIMKIVVFLKEHSLAVKTFAVFIGVLGAGILAYNGYIAITTGLTELWAAAQMLLNGAMALNPVGLVIVAIAALSAGIYYAWQKSETFRGVLLGIWEVMKMLGSVWLSFAEAWVTMFTNPLKAIDKFKAAIMGFKNLDISGAFNKGMAAGKTPVGSKQAAGNSSFGQNSAASAIAGSKPTGALGTNINGVSGGRPTHITINITKLVETFNMHAGGLRDSTIKIKEEVTKALLSAVNDSQIIAQ